VPIEPQPPTELQPPIKLKKKLTMYAIKNGESVVLYMPNATAQTLVDLVSGKTLPPDEIKALGRDLVSAIKKAAKHEPQPQPGGRYSFVTEESHTIVGVGQATA
jgi:hypothetical protein